MSSNGTQGLFLMKRGLEDMVEKEGRQSISPRHKYDDI